MNPYKILNVEKNALKKDIIKSVGIAMRQKKFSAREIAIAQKELMNPVTRQAHEFLNFIDIKPLINKLDLSTPEMKTEDNLRLLNEKLF